MTSVLHPVGPEPEETYWRRRALVLGGAVLLVVLVVALFVNGSGTGSAVSATPSPVPLSPAPPSLTAAAPGAAGDSPTPGPYDDTATPGVAPQAADDSASPTPSDGETPSASPSPSPDAGDARTAAPTTSASPSPKAKPKTKPKPKPAGPVTCSPSKVRTTLTGKQQLEAEQAASFQLSVINGSSATCLVKVAPGNFTLTISSGVDRIWSSADCAAAIKPVKEKVAPEAAVKWSVEWNGRRSASDCEVRPEIPRPGTYIATAQLRGAAPVQLRFLLTG